MKRVFFSVMFMTCVYAASAYGTNPEEGKTIFTTRCAACHSVDKKIVGPALMNVDKRHDEKWIISFVQSSQAVIKSGDTAAVNLFNSFNKTPMPDHPDLTADNIKNIVSYIQSETAQLAKAPKSTIERPGEIHPNYKPFAPTDYLVWISLAGAIAALVWVMLLRVKVESMK